jgi:hypothetical protein
MEYKDLPEILAGPIIRRCEQEVVYIWLATKYPAKIKAEFYEMETLTSEQIKKYQEEMENGEKGKLIKNLGCIGKGEVKSTPIGKNLHISLVPVKPVGVIKKKTKEGTESEKKRTEFPFGTIISYDLEVIEIGSNGKEEKGKKLKEIDGNIAKDICYGPLYDLPTFHIQNYKTKSYEDELKVLFGSCRKFHGPDYDCLSRGDDVNWSNSAVPSLRPHVLFLGGDQIYADDVAGPIIKHINKLAEAIMGYKEAVPDITWSRNLSEFNLVDRGYVINKEIGLENEEADNHLLGFGEYAATYLFAWNSFFWREDKLKMQPLSTNISSLWKNFRPNAEPGIFFGVKPEKITKYQADIENLKRFKTTIHQARRLLANVPTYMIFDDHDVTDDWNINRLWQMKTGTLTDTTKKLDTKGIKIGKYLIGNALAAYWVFQGWGNDPVEFKKEFIDSISRYLHQGKNNFSGGAHKKFEEAIFGFKNWEFITPTFPATLFLDCRTKRVFDDKKSIPLIDFGADEKLINEGASRLIDFFALYDLKKRFGEKIVGKELIICSPTPIFGYPTIEILQKFKGELWHNNPYSLDSEAWAFNACGYWDMLYWMNTQLKPKNCVILSGDVHYGFNHHIELDTSGHRVQYIQLTSSSLKNREPALWKKKALENPIELLIRRGQAVADILVPVLKWATRFNSTTYFSTRCGQEKKDWSEKRKYYPASKLLLKGASQPFTLHELEFAVNQMKNGPQTAPELIKYFEDILHGDKLLHKTQLTSQEEKVKEAYLTIIKNEKKVFSTDDVQFMNNLGYVVFNNKGIKMTYLLLEGDPNDKKIDNRNEYSVPETIPY